ncbi:hypothetical protein [Thermophagus xiamenensis]|nr:hypothetical protein [Thermophagus xiamenensis]
MKKNKILITLLALITFTFGACSDYEDTEEVSPSVSKDNPEVRFDFDNPTTFEFDPASNIEFSLSVIRNNESGKLEVPLYVLQNTENSFVFPESIVFEDGEDTTSITIGISDSAPIGEVLPFQIEIDESFINPYLETTYSIFEGEVAIIKWNQLGTVHFYDSFSFYSIAEVDLEQRDDMPEVYRINSPYTEGILLEAEWEGWIGGPTQDKIVFTVDGDNVTWEGFWYTNLLYQGVSGQSIKAYLPSAIGKEGDEQSVVVKDDDENILYFELYPSFYIDGLGGFGLNPVFLGFPGYDLSSVLELPVYED